MQLTVALVCLVFTFVALAPHRVTTATIGRTQRLRNALVNRSIVSLLPKKVTSFEGPRQAYNEEDDYEEEEYEDAEEELQTELQEQYQSGNGVAGGEEDAEEEDDEDEEDDEEDDEADDEDDDDDEERQLKRKFIVRSILGISI